FFQAEDGIRDYKVTGVQTCALPISVPGGLGKVNLAGSCGKSRPPESIGRMQRAQGREIPRRILTQCRLPVRGQRTCAKREPGHRSEERRVGKECRSRWSADR